MLELGANTAEHRVILERHSKAAGGQLMRDGIEELFDLCSMCCSSLRSSVTVEHSEEVSNIFVQAPLSGKSGC